MKTVTFYLMISSVFFLGGLTSLSPIYIMFFPLSIISVLNCIYKKKIKLGKESVLILIYILYLGISQIFILKGRFNFIFLEILSYLYYLLLKNNLYFVKINDLKKYILKLYIFAIILMSLDTFKRYLFPTITKKLYYLEKFNLGFYKYKYGSIMFRDSNSVGVLALVLYIFLEILLEKKFYKIKDIKWIRLILIFLIFFTLSRAAIIVFLGFYFIKKFQINLKKLKFIVVMIVPILITFVYIKFKSDLSFKSKFHILEESFIIVNKVGILNKIIGIGYDNIQKYIGVAGHNYLVIGFIESGLIGGGLIISIFIILYFKIKSAKKLIVAIFCINFSFLPIAKTFLFSIFAILNKIERVEKNKIK